MSKRMLEEAFKRKCVKKVRVGDFYVKNDIFKVKKNDFHHIFFTTIEGSIGKYNYDYTLKEAKSATAYDDNKVITKTQLKEIIDALSINDVWSVGYKKRVANNYWSSELWEDLQDMEDDEAASYIKKNYTTFGQVNRYLTCQKIVHNSINDYYTVRDLERHFELLERYGSDKAFEEPLQSLDLNSIQYLIFNKVRYSLKETKKPSYIATSPIPSLPFSLKRAFDHKCLENIERKEIAVRSDIFKVVEACVTVDNNELYNIKTVNGLCKKYASSVITERATSATTFHEIKDITKVELMVLFETLSVNDIWYAEYLTATSTMEWSKELVEKIQKMGRYRAMTYFEEHFKEFGKDIKFMIGCKICKDACITNYEVRDLEHYFNLLGTNSLRFAQEDSICFLNIDTVQSLVFNGTKYVLKE